MKEALKLALEFIERVNKDGWILADFEPQMYTAITAIKAALAQQDHSEQHLDMVKAQPAQEPVAIKRMKEWIEYLKRKSDFGQHMKIPCEISAGTCWELAIELEQFINTTPPQPAQERNFCSRCGKRTADLTVIHTCTPPQENT
jgi:hypothetical protein